MFAPRVRLRQLALLCRSLGTSLEAGVALIRALDTAARKTSDGTLQRVLHEVVDDIKSGQTFHEAVDGHGAYFPDLFVDMISVGELTGSLPEVLVSLSDHYENNIRLRKDFLSQITWPAIQLIAAILIVALMIYILGWIGESSQTTVDVLGFGLLGASGAIIWLMGWGLLAGGAWFAGKLISRSFTGRQLTHQALMQIPVVGGCLRDFAIARFSWAFHLTQSAGMPIDDSLDASLQATANGAFIAAAPRVIDDVMKGETLSDALQQSQLFPEEFINIVHVSETAGTVPEALHRLSPQFADQARRSLKTLTTIAGWLVWLCVAGFIIFVIFRIVFWYIGMLSSFASNPLG